jgi:aspartate kinase
MASRCIVQKFGGTSVSTVERRAQVAGHVARARGAGHEVAIVVSAMGRRGDPYATDTLLDLLRVDGGAVDPADYNMVFVTGEMIAAAVVSQTLKRAGIPAVPMSGVQAGLFAGGDSRHAEVTHIDTSRLEYYLGRGQVPVVTGGQAVFPETLEFATLGRGASDTSGVLLGVALEAERVEIFTDVTGVATTDPRLVPGARWIRSVSFGRMHELARFGAKVVHPRAIMAGWKAHMPIAVRSTFSNDPGTLIGDDEDQAPLLGLAVLSPMETRLVAPAGVDDDRRREWERERLIMSIHDHSSGLLALGIAADNAGELDRVLEETGLQPASIVPASAWISVIGDTAALRARRGEFRAALADAGAVPTCEEEAPNRTTFVIPAISVSRGVPALHARCWGPALMCPPSETSPTAAATTECRQRAVKWT